MAYLLRGNHRVNYEDHGSGENTILLLHGWGMSVRVWDATMLALVDAGYRVVMMDHRGCGKSDMDFDDFSIDAIAGDAVELVQELDLGRVVLNGWSLGGAVAVKAASMLGEVCSGLVLTCAASPIYIQKPDLPLGGTPEDMAGTIAALKEDRITFLSGLSQGVCATPVDDAVVQWMWRLFTEASPRAVATIAELGPLDQRELLAGLDTPILSIIGAQDAIVAPDICRWAAQNNSRATAVEFEQSGHAPFIEERERYMSELLGFLSGLG